MIHLTGYFFSVIIGFSLGLIGGGGSILTIPVLVYFFEIDPAIAATYSLFIVGLTAVSGSITHCRMHNIDYKALVLFGIPSVIVLFIMRKWILNLIPSIIFQSGQLIITKSFFIMIVFSILMLIAGLSMIKQNNYAVLKGKQNFTRLIFQGGITGAVTGFIGIGGGFIIVPSLVLFAGLPIKKAIGTSLTIITINCLVGLLGNLKATEALNFIFLLSFAALAILGMFAGTWVTKFINDQKLKPIFGWIILSISIIVFIKVFKI
jgi:uncharacterized membrane protein YfcA